MKLFTSINNKKGVTLVENVIGLVIVGIVFASFLQVCNISSILLQNVKFRIRAINIAQAELEEIKSMNYDSVVISDYTPYKSAGVIIDEGPASGSGDDITGVMRTIVKTATNPPTTGKKIYVRVFWTLLGSVREEIAETVIYP